MVVEKVLEMVKSIKGVSACYKDSIQVYRESHKGVQVQVHDFEGFDDDWGEVPADYDVEALEAFEELLQSKAVKSGWGVYYFDDFVVVVDYDSEDV